LGPVPGLKDDRETGISVKSVRSDIEKELKQRLSPEFMNRIDEVVIFNPLSKENLRSIASVMLARIPVKVEADEKALDFLVNARYDATMGARPLRRTIEDLVVEPLANEIIRGKISEHDRVRLGVAEDQITFERICVAEKEEKKEKGRPGAPQPPATPGGDTKICAGKGCGEINEASAKWCKKCGRELS